MIRFNQYLDTIRSVNNLGKDPEDVQWMAHTGMLFLTWDKWWGDFRYRPSAHEGVDITYYRDRAGRLHQFSDAIHVPAMADGIVLTVCRDFLGQTIVAELPEESDPLGQSAEQGSSLTRSVLAYAHIVPDRNIQPGDKISRDQIIAHVCDTVKNPLLPPHLHLSCFVIPRQMPAHRLNWELFSQSTEIALIHPWFL